MTDLLAEVLDAHGGTPRWSDVNEVRGHLNIDGAFWGMKGWPKSGTDLHLAVNPRRQHITLTNLTAPGIKATLDAGADYVRLEGADGELLEHRDDPRASFDGFTLATPWDRVHLAYFMGYALWNYLTMPFMLTMPGVLTEEIEPLADRDDTWRTLRVTYPDSIIAHERQQDFYFDADFMLRRNDYVPHVLPDIMGSHRTDQHQSFDGIVVPTRRIVYPLAPETKEPFAPHPGHIITVDVLSFGVS